MGQQLKHMLAPDCSPSIPFSMGKVSLNLALALVLLADAVERLHVGDLHAVGQGEGP